MKGLAANAEDVVEPTKAALVLLAALVNGLHV